MVRLVGPARNPLPPHTTLRQAKLSMQFSDVCIESIGYTLPREIWTSDQVEARLGPLYERLKLPEGRLELMTGIRERRFWPADVRPSQVSVASCHRAIEAAEISPDRIGLLIHGSVCRDHLEPATACSVHHHLDLTDRCVVYDVSNACLGLLNGMLQAANQIELGQIEAALVVGSEGGRQLVETTIEMLNRKTGLTRKTIKTAIASLTIGSASCAVLLAHRNISRTGTRLRAAAVTANTRYHDLCQSRQDQAGSGMQPLMETDSEALMMQGIATGKTTLERFFRTTGWDATTMDKTIGHQVGEKHRQLLLESLGLDQQRDFVTFPWLGNTGSAALPVTLARACEASFIEPGDRVGLMGIGSGINCIMIACEWGHTPVVGAEWEGDRIRSAAP